MLLFSLKFLYLRDHWPALTTPLPCINTISFSGLVNASFDAKKNEVGSFPLLCAYNYNSKTVLKPIEHFSIY